MSLPNKYDLLKLTFIKQADSKVLLDKALCDM